MHLVLEYFLLVRRLWSEQQMDPISAIAGMLLLFGCSLVVLLKKVRFCVAETPERGNEISLNVVYTLKYFGDGIFELGDDNSLPPATEPPPRIHADAGGRDTAGKWINATFHTQCQVYVSYCAS